MKDIISAGEKRLNILRAEYSRICAEIADLSLERISLEAEFSATTRRPDEAATQVDKKRTINDALLSLENQRIRIERSIYDLVSLCNRAQKLEQDLQKGETLDLMLRYAEDDCIRARERIDDARFKLRDVYQQIARAIGIDDPQDEQDGELNSSPLTLNVM